MNKIKKLMDKLYSNPKDFTYKEANTLLNALGLKENNKGKTSGSRVIYVGKYEPLTMHKPHPGNELKDYQVRDIKKFLENEGFKHD